MASISIRNGRFLVRIRRDSYKLVAKTFTRKQDAVTWARMVEAAMEAGRWRDAVEVVPTLAAASRTYKIEVAARLKGDATYAYWLDELAASFLGPKPVDQIAPRDLSLWRDKQLAAGLKPGTVTRKLGLVSGIFTWCHKERGWVSSNPMRSVSRLRFNDDRFDRFGSAMQEQREQALHAICRHASSVSGPNAEEYAFALTMARGYPRCLVARYWHQWRGRSQPAE